jgi:C4-type Zn-finger protein
VYIVRDEKNKDKMSEIIQVVREVMQGSANMNANEILKRLGKSHLQALKLSKEELMDALLYYKKLSIIYIDEEENVVFL